MVKYWKRESLVDGSIIALYKVEEDSKETKCYFYKNGNWQEDKSGSILTKVMWEDDYDFISEAEANHILKQRI